MTMRSRRARGFTLIELMMVVAIIGLLATIAIPAYQDYVIRSKMSEVLVVADIGKRAVDEYYGRWGTFPDGNEQAGLPAPEAFRSRFVVAMSVTQGMIKVPMGLGGAFEKGPKELGFTFYLRPLVNKAHPSAPLAWLCSSSDKGAAGLPFDLIGKAGTDAPPAKYLPAACR